MYRFSAWRAGTKPYLSYWPARLHRLAKSIPRNRLLGSINFYKYGLRDPSTPPPPHPHPLKSKYGTHTQHMPAGNMKCMYCCERARENLPFRRPNKVHFSIFIWSSAYNNAIGTHQYSCKLSGYTHR
jgi:hypothetical protein